MSTKPIVGTWGPILFGVACPSDIAVLEGLVTDIRRKTNSLALAADEKWQQYEKATDRKIKRSIWNEYEELFNEYQIMCAWLDAAKAARTFAEKGFKSSYLDGVQYIPVVDDEALPYIDL